MAKNKVEKNDVKKWCNDGNQEAQIIKRKWLNLSQKNDSMINRAYKGLFN